MVFSAVLVSFHASAALWDWQEHPHGRKAKLRSPGSGKPGFTLMPSAVAFTNVLTDERGLTNQIYMSGSGVAAGDIDGDGWCDLYVCGIDSRNRLFRNRGDWHFDAGALLGPDYPTTGATFADVDGDSDLDLLVSGLARGVRLYLNDGRGQFSDATDQSGLRSQSAAMTLALGDIDGDGDLDLYVSNFRSSTLQDEAGVSFRLALTNGQPVIRSIDGRKPTVDDLTRYNVSPQKAIVENGEGDALYRNDGHGLFTALSWVDGTFVDEQGKALSAPPYDWTYTAMFRDMNGDGSPDIYTCSDNVSPDRIWINDGRGRFRALPTLALRHTSLASMGVDFADINRDGLDDIFVADMMAREHGLRQRLMSAPHALVPPGPLDYRIQYMRNTLFLNRGDGSYAEIAQLSGVDASDWSWSPIFLDVDLDGYEDLLITTGLERSLRDADARRQIDARRTKGNLSTRQFLEMRRIMPRLETPNYAFRNRGDLTFENASDTWGFNSRAVSSGMALADLDNDGDMDVVVNVLNGPLLVYRNNGVATRVAVRLKGKGPNTHGVGACIKVTGGPVMQSQEMICGGRYLSGDEMVRTFAAGTTIEVTWRSGLITTITNLPPDHVYEVHEYGVPVDKPPKGGTPHFADVSDLLNHTHAAELANDFEGQPLLPRQLSRIGPEVRWADLNGDGWEDLVIAGYEVFLNQTGKTFVRSNASQPPKMLSAEPEFLSTYTNIAGIPGWWNCVATGDFDKDGRKDLVAGNWGRNTKYQSYVRRPLHTFYGDANGDGTAEIIEAFEEPATGKLRPWRSLDTMARAMPWLAQQFPTFAAYSVADVDQILGEARTKMKDLQVNTLDSMLFLNRGDRFYARPLPIEAQFAPVFGICVADFDDDGSDDLFLAQNFFGPDLDTSCYDAGQGLLLRGDGRGNFAAVSAKESGIAIYGEQRGCAVCDFDHDGRPDLAVTQHGAATKLFRNQHTKR
jgi:VCBS repeat protein/ASPIC/UnbV protein